ncbi:MAG TPA: hypothetical protein VE053_03370 [Allosphingosinicella sp.]|nr:hypothetical protein [Allosphingosinicella sp.]
MDDIASEAKSCAASLASALDFTSRAFVLDDGLAFEAKVIPFFPEKNEFADDFEARFERTIRLMIPDMRQDSIRMQAILFDLAFEFPAKQGGTPTSGERLAEIARRWRPNVSRYGLTSLTLSRKPQTPITLIKTPFKKDQLDTDAAASRVAQEILKDFQDRFATPIWDGLMQFSRQSKVPMHAMASTEARQAEVSYAVGPFLRLLGSTYHQIEATSTKYPLDSLLSPSGSIKATQEMVARSFGARASHLVTNGTSTANKIVYSAMLSEGDYVLVDECCHISHHVALALTGACAIYVRPESTTTPGISGQVSTDSVAAALEMLITSHPDKVLPKLISLTNCTFDGMLLDPAELFDCVLSCLDKHGLANRLGEITFLFDEAWFSFGYFHPEYVRFSAMGAANFKKAGIDGRFWESQLNVISTQSLHKTAFALRQASVILKNIGSTALARSGRSIDARFAASVKMFTTTSPSMPILASIDWARRQFDIEGCALVEAAHEAVALFRELYGGGADNESPIFLDPLVHHGGEVPTHDRTKVTLRSRAMSGKELRDALWDLDSVKVQVNKFAADSVLLMFMPGFTDRSSALLRTAISELMEKLAAYPAREHDLAVVPLPSLSDAEFIGADGETTRYPDALSRRDGLTLRRAVFNAPPGQVETVRLNEELAVRVKNGERLLALDYVTPYPPGYPILLPGQLITLPILDYLGSMEHGEIHGIQAVPNGKLLTVCALNGTQPDLGAADDPEHASFII